MVSGLPVWIMKWVVFPLHVLVCHHELWSKQLLYKNLFLYSKDADLDIHLVKWSHMSFKCELVWNSVQLSLSTGPFLVTGMELQISEREAVKIQCEKQAAQYFYGLRIVKYKVSDNYFWTEERGNIEYREPAMECWGPILLSWSLGSCAVWLWLFVDSSAWILEVDNLIDMIWL